MVGPLLPWRPAGRRPARISCGRRSALGRKLVGRIGDAEAFQAGIDRTLHHALAFAGPAVPVRRGGRSAAEAVASGLRLVRPLFLIEGRLNPLQLADQRRALRADGVSVTDLGSSLVDVAQAILPDDAPPALTATLPLTGPRAIGAGRFADWATRAKISSRGPNAIDRPS